MNEELCHRNMAFTLYQADEMPQMSMGEPTVEKLGGRRLQGLRRHHQPQGDADDPGPGGAEHRRAARTSSPSTARASR